jgi:hypothetical protein
MPRTDVHQTALAQFDRIQDAVWEEREQCLSDRRFYSISGAQWEGDLGKQFENRPRFEVNKVHLSVIRIINEYRNNRITVDFVAKDGKENSLADTCDGRYRADEQDSNGQDAYDNAFEEAVGGGIGAWRLITCYEDDEDDENEYQRIAVEPIYDADSSVFFDLNSKKQDKSDAKHCFVIRSISRDAYIEEYDDDPVSWTKDIDSSEFDWVTPDVVYIAEYYVIEKIPKTIEIWENLDGEESRYSEDDFEHDENLFEMLTATGSRKVRDKTVKKNKVHKYILNGDHVIEDCGYIAGNCIPIVPVYGKRWFIDNIERCMGHVRLCKDAQRLKNMQLSKLGEISALSTIEKPIMTPEQISGHEDMWADDNIKNYPYLLTNPVIDMNGNIQPAGPLGYTKVPQIPPAMGALLQITEQDMQDMLGNQQAGEEITPNVSGKAIELIQNKLDMQSFIYMSNMSKAVKRSGEIWLSMAKEVYVEEDRNLKIVTPQKDVDSIKLMEPTVNQESGAVEYKNDFSRAKFDLTVSVGPSTASKRAATVRALTGMLQMTADPSDQAVITGLAMMNMEGEGIDEIRQYYRKKLINMGAIEPNEEEAKEIQARQQAQAQQPDPNQQYLAALSAESMAKAEKAKADTQLTAMKAQQSQVDTIHTVAKAEETRAKTAQIMSEMDTKSQRAVVENIKDLTQIEQQKAPTAPSQ